jgi:hypothetical protein
MQKTKSSAKSNFDVIILGGGIVGCACARECALAGMRVALVEADGIAGGATGAAMGHIVALTTYSRALWMDLREQLPPNIEYEMRGTIWIAADEQELAEVYAKHNSYSTAGIDAAILDSRELAATEPNLRKGLAGGLLVPGDGVNYPPAAATFFLEEALRAGTVLLQGQQAVSAGDNSLTLNNGDSYNAKAICRSLSIIPDLCNINWLSWATLKARRLFRKIRSPSTSSLARTASCLLVHRANIVTTVPGLKTQSSRVCMNVPANICRNWQSFPLFAPGRGIAQPLRINCP